MPANLFGSRTDQFGLTESGEVFENIATVTASSRVPVSQDRTDANDANGDITASAYFGNTEGNLYEISTTYMLKSGHNLDLSSLKIGELSVGTGAGVVADNITITTSNGDELPTVEISGMEGTEPIEAPDGKLNTFTLPSLSIKGAYIAQPIGFSVDEGKLTGSTLTASITLSDSPDGVGEIIAHGVAGGTMEISADFVAITTAAAWTVSSADFTETSAPGSDEPQADFETASASAEGILERDSS